MALRILMLGWEFPPHISGGLGTACEGLSRSLARAGSELLFVLPRLLGGESSSDFSIIDSDGNDASRVEGEHFVAQGGGGWNLSAHSWATAHGVSGGTRTVVAVPSGLKPYLSPEQFLSYARSIPRSSAAITAQGNAAFSLPDFAHYGMNMFEEVQQYALKIVHLFSEEKFDVIHAHDWMTYPAAIALGKTTGKPVVAHVHSLETDRSGAGSNDQIAAIERWGLQEAQAVIGVSFYTKSLIEQTYGIPGDKIHVVHNGVYPHAVTDSYRRSKQWAKHVVLFLGRITFQKGPDYFVEAAARVIPIVSDVQFVMAGSGDMLEPLRRRVAELGIERYFYFPGFLRGPEVENMFSVADVYVMPSVSEPFGISALEAISYNTPVIMSKQAGVAEVLRHALKVDFWDVERMADLIVNALLFPELRSNMVSMAREELKRLRWDAAAQRTLDVYRQVL